MSQRTRDHVLDLILWVVLALAFITVVSWISGCSTMKQALYTGGAGAAGAGIGMLAPPFGPVIGAGICAMIGGSMAVSDAMQKVAIASASPHPAAPWFLRWETWALAAALYYLLRNREHLLAFLKVERGQKLKTTARGLLHSVVGGKVGKPQNH